MHTFSSEMMSPRNTALLVAFLVTALAFAVIQLLAPQLRLNDPRSPIAARIKLLSHRDAELVFLGSSRFLSCIDEKTAEESLGLTPGKALNLSGNGLHPYDFLVIVREAGQSGTLRAGTAIIEIEPSQFNANGRSPMTGAPIPYPRAMKRWATWRERAVFPTEARLELLRSLFAPLALRRALPA